MNTFELSSTKDYRTEHKRKKEGHKCLNSSFTNPVFIAYQQTAVGYLVFQEENAANHLT